MEGDSEVTQKFAADLVLKFYVKKSLCAASMLDALDEVLRTYLTDWRSGLRLLPEHEEHRDSGLPVAEKDFGLAEAVAHVAPIRFGLCAVNLVGAYEGVTIFLQGSRSSLPPESNLVTIEICDIPTVEGKTTEKWATSFFREFVTAIPVRYAHARTRAEFHAKNMVQQERSVRAVGVNLKRAVPGLYWMNFFGREYLDLIGIERFATVPLPFVETLDDGICIGIGEDPNKWDTVEYRQREERGLAHLGREYFFTKADSERATKAPAFTADRD